MSGSIFISKDPRIELLLMKAYFHQLYKYETQVKGKLSQEAVEEYGFHTLDFLVWMGLRDFLLREDEKKAEKAADVFPYLGSKREYRGAEVLYQQMKERLSNLFLEDHGADIDPSRFAEEYVDFAPLRNYQTVYFRLLILAKLAEIHKAVNLEFPEDFAKALDEAKQEEEAARREIYFPMSFLVQRRKRQSDKSKGKGKIVSFR